MRQNAGLFAIITTFLAIVGISNLAKNSPVSAPESAAANKTKVLQKPTSTKTRITSPACDEIENRLRPFFTSPTGTPNTNVEPQYPQLCYEHGEDAGKGLFPLPPNVHFVIATVPNPISTHLPLVFDRMIEAIEQAAADDNYSYESSWFPWNEPEKKDDSFTDQRAAEKAQKLQEGQPGVLVFRGAVAGQRNQNATSSKPYEDGLIVFVVAEQPTAGIDRTEFENAVGWIDWLGGLRADPTIKILGPSFSGSLPSLDQGIESEKLNSSPPRAQIAVEIYSGGVSSESSYWWFKHRISPLGKFQTAMESDSLMLDRFLQYLQCQKYPLHRVAIISEDETAFGASARASETVNNPNKGSCRQTQTIEDEVPVSLLYPRDIATLRSEYEKQSIFNTGKPQAATPATSTTLRGDLSEPNSSDNDTVRSYGGELTPLAQESVLLSISSVLKEKQIQFIVLRSTNSLDQIFLTQFFRRAYPAGRVVIDGADLLFARGAEGTYLRGVMTLSTYPLSEWQQDWVPSLHNRNNRSYRIFGQDLAEGVYVAARDLFRDPHHPSVVPITNYATPLWALTKRETDDDPRPPTWLSVIGHHQFWPVAVLRGPAEFDPGASELLPTASQKNDLPVLSDEPQRHPLRLPTELVIVLIACSIWTGLHFFWCRDGSINPSPSLFRLAQFAPLGGKEHSALIAFGSFLPPAVAITTAATCGLLDWSLDWNRGSILAVWCTVIILASCAACWKNFGLPTSSDKPPARWLQIVGAAAVVALSLLIVLHLRLILNLRPENRVPAHWRSAHLLSGVSPLVPQLLLISGMYLWFWFALRGLALFGDDRPLLPSLNSLPMDPENGHSTMPMFSQEDGGDPVERKAAPVGTYYWKHWILPITLVATTLVFGLVLQGASLRTTGEKFFGSMIFFWISLSIAVILADTIQLWTSWRQLRSLLVYLDRLPLRRTLASLGGLSWGSVWKMSGSTLSERHRVISRQIESLIHLRNIIRKRSVIEHTASDYAASTKIEECILEGHDFAKWYLDPKNRFQDRRPLREFQEELAATAGSIITNVLCPAWQQETRSLIIVGVQENGKSENRDAASPALPDPVPKYVRAAEEFVVLPYVAFIQNILGRMRTIVLGCLFLFVATTFAVSSYPFDPLPVLGGIFLSVFLITGGTVMVVLAQMHRDTTLSNITETEPGTLDSQFWVHLVTFGVGPVLGLLTTLFPSITDFVSAWLAPGAQALK